MVIHQPGEFLQGLLVLSLGIAYLCTSFSKNPSLKRGKSTAEYVVLSLSYFIIGLWRLAGAFDLPHHESQLNIILDKFFGPLLLVLMILAVAMVIQRKRKNKTAASDAIKPLT